MYEEQRLDIGEVALSFVEWPDNGPPLLMLHGGTDRWQTFEPIIPAFVDDWHAFAMDFRGHGGSGSATTGYTMPDYARDVALFIGNRIGEPTVLMGHSMGADTSVVVAAEHPDLVLAALLEEPIYSHNGTRLKDFAVYPSLLAFQEALSISSSAEDIALALSNVRPNWPKSLVDEKAECLSKLDPLALSTIVESRHTDGYDTEDLMPRIDAPVLLIQGNPSRGGLLNDEEAKRMTELLRRCEFVQMPRGGHEPHSRLPEEFLSVTKEFLSAL